VIWSTARRVFQRLRGPAWTFDPVGAGVRLPAIALCLLAGLLTRRPLWGSLAAGGAFSTGFGAPLDLAGSSPLLLVVVSLGCGIAAVIGSLSAGHGALAVATLAAIGILCGLASARGAALGWIALQCGLTAIIATSYPAPLHRAGLRAVVIAGGGLAQVAALMLAGLFRWKRPSATTSDPTDAWHALRIGLALAIATAVERTLAIRNGYWVPLTTLLVLRPDAQRTFPRTLARTAGTVGGAAIASVLLLSLRLDATFLAILIVAAAFGAYLFQKATYGLFSASVTLYVVFILSFIGLPEGQVSVARIVATVLGSAVALAIHGLDLVWLRVRSRRARYQ
jgi:hypothetical protein